MKYTIFGFSQERAISLGLDDRDLMILRWFVDYSDTSKMISRIVDGEVYYWVKYEGIAESFPITKWKKDTVYRRLSNMVKVGVLKHKTIKEAGVWSYYKKGDKYGELIDTEYYNKVEINSSEKNPKRMEKTPKQTEQISNQTEQNPKQNINPLYSSINDSSIINFSDKFDENSTEFQLSLYLYELVNKNFNIKKPNLQTWATHIDKIIRIDGRSTEEVKKVIDWSQQDDFWKQNIRSTNKLRKHYAQLCMKMNTDKNFQYSKGIEKKSNSSSLNANSTYNYDINSLIEKMQSEV